LNNRGLGYTNNIQCGDVNTPRTKIDTLRRTVYWILPF